MRSSRYKIFWEPSAIVILHLLSKQPPPGSLYAAKAGGEGKLFFSSITAVFAAQTIEDAAGAAEVASRTKGNLAYFYNALNKIREAKNINLTPETQEQFGNAEDSIDI